LKGTLQIEQAAHVLRRIVVVKQHGVVFDQLPQRSVIQRALDSLLRVRPDFGQVSKRTAA
jgi:hypothetical protein